MGDEGKGEEMRAVRLHILSRDPSFYMPLTTLPFHIFTNMHQGKKSRSTLYTNTNLVIAGFCRVQVTVWQLLEVSWTSWDSVVIRHRTMNATPMMVINDFTSHFAIFLCSRQTTEQIIL